MDPVKFMLSVKAVGADDAVTNDASSSVWTDLCGTSDKSCGAEDNTLYATPTGRNNMTKWFDINEADSKSSSSRRQSSWEIAANDKEVTKWTT